MLRWNIQWWQTRILEWTVCTLVYNLTWQNRLKEGGYLHYFSVDCSLQLPRPVTDQAEFCWNIENKRFFSRKLFCYWFCVSPNSCHIVIAINTMNWKKALPFTYTERLFIVIVPSFVQIIFQWTNYCCSTTQILGIYSQIFWRFVS